MGKREILRKVSGVTGALLLCLVALLGCSAAPAAPDITFDANSHSDPNAPHSCAQYSGDDVAACHQGETYAKSDGATESSAREQCKQQPLAGQPSSVELITACEYGVLFVFHPGA